MAQNPFDKPSDLADLNRESLLVDEEGQEQAPQPPPLPKDAKSWDFRHGKMPEQVMVINDQLNEAHLEVQQDRSTALVLPPKSYLKFDRTSMTASAVFHVPNFFTLSLNV